MVYDSVGLVIAGISHTLMLVVAVPGMSKAIIPRNSPVNIYCRAIALAIARSFYEITSKQAHLAIFTGALHMKKSNFHLAMLGMLVVALSISPQLLPALASDHTDTPLHIDTGRDDARITDFWSFVQNGRLVMIMGINPFLPAEVREYVFPTDVTYRFFIDQDSRVNFNDPVVNAAFGGTVANPIGIREDISFNVTFDRWNRPQVEVVGRDLSECQRIRERMRVFSGLRAEAFIFAPFVNNNIGAIVIDVPLEEVKKDNDTLLLWVTSSVDDFAGQFQELGGRTLNSQFPEKLALNFIHPSQHRAALGLNPDVIILNTREPSRFPNGRRLQDDIVNLVAALPAPFNDARALNNEIAMAGFSATINDIAPLPGAFPDLANPNR
jgi:hypothetical protein